MRSLRWAALAAAGGIVSSQSVLAQSDVMGEWSDVLNWPIVAIHQMYLPTGKVLMWGRGDLGDYPLLYDPDTNSFEAVERVTTDVFCAGHSFLSDGTALIAGGHISDGFGLPDTLIYNPYDGATGKFYRKADMVEARWYPTCTTLADGRVVVVSGTIAVYPEGKVWADKTEVFDPETGEWTTTTTDWRIRGYYRFVHVIPDGRALLTGSTIWWSLAYNPVTGVWDTVGVPNRDVYGMASVQWETGKIIKSGGPTSETDLTAAPGTAIWNWNNGVPAWTTVAPMNFARREHDLTALPDGTILATGGSDVFDGQNTAVFEAELYDPATNTWRVLAAEQIPRSYHSSAILLRDGRVMVAGGGNGGGRRPEGSTDRLNAEIFSPPYLFKGPRPQILTVPTATYYGRKFEVSTDTPEDISIACLIAPAAVTHGYDENQRRLALAFEVKDGKLEVSAPANSKLAPPGPYMLFLVNSNGVPSIAEFVNVGEALPTITPPWHEVEGIKLGGDFASLEAADGNVMSLRPTQIAARSGSSVSLHFGASVPENHIGSFALEFESLGSGNYKVEFYDYLTGQWKEVASGVETRTLSSKRIARVDYATRYLHPGTNTFHSRITWDFGPITRLPVIKLDRLNYIVAK